MSKNVGLIIVLSGPSGVGKGTVNRILQKTNTNIMTSVSVTTRPPREGELEGVSYYFKSREEFELLIKEDSFVEYACVYGNYYGTLKSELERIIGMGKSVILEIDTYGAKNIKKLIPNSVSIFVLPPSLAELERRIEGRGTEECQSLTKRVIAAKEEIAFARYYDYIVVNDEATCCASEVATIIRAEMLKVKNNSALIDDIIGGNNIC
ncbi:MAG: guanylate kinase [Clostridia bacterium]|nr:guanylate kinase [Clostridia bacterium]